MYLVDTDVLIHASVAGAERHRLARQWLNERLGGRGHTVGLPWPSLFGFITTTTEHLDPPAETKHAWEQVRRWLDAPAAWTPVPGHQHPSLITDILDSYGEARHLMPNIHLAALAIEHGLTLATTDPIYRKFPFVRMYDPIHMLNG